MIVEVVLFFQIVDFIYCYVVICMKRIRLVGECIGGGVKNL